MKRSRRAGWILGIAVAAALSAGRAEAQFRVGDDGRALDANNRIDSAGWNHFPFAGSRESLLPGARPVGAAAVTGNQIVTGNVTAGKGFRGNVPYTDPRDFRGNVGGSGMDRFIAGSAGSPAPYQAAPMPLTVQAQPYYGARLAAPPPPGFAPRGFTGIYTPAPQAQQQQTPADTFMRLGLPLEQRVNGLNTMLLPGQVDPQTGLPSVLSDSLVRSQASWSAAGDFSPLSSFNSLRQDSGISRLRADPRQLLQMRQELTLPGGRLQDRTGNNATDPSGQGQGPTGSLSRPMVTPFDAPATGALSPSALTSDVTSKPLDTSMRPEQGMSSRLLNPTQQSTQQAELQNRLNRYYVDRLQTDEDRNRELLRQLRQRDAAEKATDAARKATQTPDKPQADVVPGGAGSPRPGDVGTTPGSTQAPGGVSAPGVGTLPGGSALGPDYAAIGREIARSRPGAELPGVAPAARPAPLKVTSLAQGVKAEGLARLLKQAETLMKQGKYISATEQYEAAEAVAPNNAMVTLGRANAELGAGLYKKSEQHLRQAMQADPSLTMAQYDLSGMMGQERLEALVKDLKEAARKQPDDGGLVLLLAYLAYNTGNEAQVPMFLNEAEKRNPRDMLPRLLRTHWTLPASAAPTTRPATGG